MLLHINIDRRSHSDLHFTFSKLETDLRCSGFEVERDTLSASLPGQGRVPYEKNRAPCPVSRAQAQEKLAMT